ncbi:indole-3-glycerol phosphate synthase [Legionella beliardensis]|uniref:Indole-3-glycerol phosphate synthase n=1 Tax=Legionella beliardensis TaxID=91822 RepID=A0A378I0A4_9GAMM|nr:indole-3-glycerol phosphate synthase TrpC [Legionella beliardensis]STX28628.1 indole-3-glycerol phosphate synthase [Legionella beliardensis]
MTTSILQKIAQQKLLEVQAAKKKRPLASFADLLIEPTRDFIAAMKQSCPAIIAEIKKASPSKGIIRQDFDVAKIAKIYEDNGAACLSVLTDSQFFQGELSYIELAKKNSSLPILRKDFIIDSYQITESRALGADCILLIVDLLSDNQLLDYCQEAQALNMAVLVESHNKEELHRAIKLPTPLIGINNRSLHTFITDLNVTLTLAPDIPNDKIIITESGINTPGDIALMLRNNIHSFLIGESLMRATNIGRKLQELIQAK